MKILRLTRHAATDEQLTELRRIYGDQAEVSEVSETVPDAGRVKELVAEHGADVLEAVLPLPLLADVVHPKFGVQIPVIRAVTNRVIGEDGQKATFVFSHYEGIKEVKIVVERL